MSLIQAVEQMEEEIKELKAQLMRYQLMSTEPTDVVEMVMQRNDDLLNKVADLKRENKQLKKLAPDNLKVKLQANIHALGLARDVIGVREDEIKKLKRQVEKDDGYFNVICEALNIDHKSRLSDILVAIAELRQDGDT